MLLCFLILLIIAKKLFSRMISSTFVMEVVALVTVSKLLMFQIENFVLFIDYGDASMIVKLFK